MRQWFNLRIAWCRGRRALIRDINVANTRRSRAQRSLRAYALLVPGLEDSLEYSKNKSRTLSEEISLLKAELEVAKLTINGLVASHSQLVERAKAEMSVHVERRVRAEGPPPADELEE